MRTYILPFAEKNSRILLMFMDEASFGRISEPSYCWCPAGIRPTVPCQKIREYLYLFGAVNPITGDDYFIIAPKCNAEWTSEFLKAVSKEFENDYLLICTDNASWHKTKKLCIPDNIYLHFLPPYTPEMNPTEQIWIEIRNDGFKNTSFNTLNDVEDKLVQSTNSLSQDTVMSITGREWILNMFN